MLVLFQGLWWSSLWFYLKGLSPGFQLLPQLSDKKQTESALTALPGAEAHTAHQGRQTGYQSTQVCGLRPRCRWERDCVCPSTGSGILRGPFPSAAAPMPGLWPLRGCAWFSGRPILSPSKPCRQPDTCRQHLNCPVRQFGC